MKKCDVLVFGSRAWMVIEPGDKVRLRLLAGPAEEARQQTVLNSMLQGRPIYRMVSALDDVDLDNASEEATGELTISDFADDPRKWTEAFCRIHGSRQTPDQTIMLGWIATAIEAGREAGKASERARLRPLVRTPTPRKAPTTIRKPGKTPVAKKTTPPKPINANPVRPRLTPPKKNKKK